MNLDPIISGLEAAVIAGLTFGVTYMSAKRLGLTTAQQAADTQQQRLISAMKARLDLLEQEVKEKSARILLLEEENRRLTERVDVLETALADRAVAGQRRRETT